MSIVYRKCPECGFEDEVELLKTKDDKADSYIEVLCGECDKDYTLYEL